jgi:hypothetical protein
MGEIKLQSTVLQKKSPINCICTIIDGKGKGGQDKGKGEPIRDSAAERKDPLETQWQREREGRAH